MIKITENISIGTNGENFIIEHTNSDNEKYICYTGVCYIYYADTRYQTSGLLQQLLEARAWFVCNYPASLDYDYSDDSVLERRLISDLSLAIVVLDGKEVFYKCLESGQFIKKFEIEINNKIHIVECDITWKHVHYESDFPSCFFEPKFKWWFKEDEDKAKYGLDNKSLFKKSVEFGTIFPSSWKKLLNNRNLNQFIIDMINHY